MVGKSTYKIPIKKPKWSYLLKPQITQSMLKGNIFAFKRTIFFKLSSIATSFFQSVVLTIFVTQPCVVNENQLKVVN